MMERKIQFDNRPLETGGVEAYEPVSETGSVPVEAFQIPPDDIVRLANEGLKMVALKNSRVEPSAHVNVDNWYGHKSIKPTGRQLYGPGR